MKDDTRVRAMMATALVLAIAAMLAGPAGARPIDDTGKTLTASERASLRPDDKGGLQGVGSIADPQVVIPYVSQGKGVDESQFGGQPAGREHYTMPGSADAPTQPASAPQSDDRTGWLEPTTFGVAIAGLVLAGMALVSTRRRDGDKVAV
jgi:hypothetical protein